jgi:hypothetical protein
LAPSLKKLLKDIAKGRILSPDTGGGRACPPPPWIGCSLFCYRQEAIVFSPFLRIAEGRKGHGDSFEDLRIVGIVLRAIRMMAHGQFPVCLLNLVN